MTGLNAATETIFVTGRQLDRGIWVIAMKVWGEYIREEKACLRNIIYTETSFNDELNQNHNQGKVIEQIEKPPLNGKCQTFVDHIVIVIQ